jgi:hypothetical protein
VCARTAATQRLNSSLVRQRWSKGACKGVSLPISRIFSCSLSGSANGPTEMTPCLLARREHVRIGLNYHFHHGPLSNGRTKRRRTRICECAGYPPPPPLLLLSPPHPPPRPLASRQWPLHSAALRWLQFPLPWRRTGTYAHTVFLARPRPLG